MTILQLLGVIATPFCLGYVVVIIGMFREENRRGWDWISVGLFILNSSFCLLIGGAWFYAIANGGRI